MMGFWFLWNISDDCDWPLDETVANYWLMGPDYCVTVFDINIIIEGAPFKMGT